MENKWTLYDEDKNKIVDWTYSPTMDQVMRAATHAGLCIGIIKNNFNEQVLINLEITN